jgi:arginyl-tRNA synthetase
MPAFSVRGSVETAVAAALGELVSSGVLTLAEGTALPAVELSYPKQKEHGDFATNIAMKLAKPAGKPPRDVAALLVEKLAANPVFATVEIAGPGFINLRVAPALYHQGLAALLAAGDSFGRLTQEKPEKINVEFVSANPTGPLHLGHGRGAVLGDTVASLLEWAGHDVTREFYINDLGNQVRNLGLSLKARYHRHYGIAARIPDEDGYHNDYLIDVAEKFAAKFGDRYLHDESEETLQLFITEGTGLLRERIAADCEKIGVKFDVWTSERALNEAGAIAATLTQLRASDDILEADGAVWFRAAKYGDEKDRVVIKSSGEKTYLLGDIAYHKNKLDRGFDRLINIWGSDHHGYIPRMKSAIQALGLPAEKLQVLPTSMVAITRNGEPVKLSKRGSDGNAVLDKNVPNDDSTFFALRDLVDEIGADAVRVFFLQRSPETEFELDLELAKKKSNDNPVFYVQYGHARMCSLLKRAAEQNIALPTASDALASLATLTDPEELALAKEALRFPEVVTTAAHGYSPMDVLTYLNGLIAAFHHWYTVTGKAGDRIIGTDIERTRARLALVTALRATLANGLSLLGISAPEEMHWIAEEAA